ncbi:hypothetical protein [Levilactobacillus bambusae]|uniref:Uncharacterized protein n=1 Tax=Levilactobacillus bambusae TaxID=2024736 RepID=A0A2V1N6J0_9LACO|nr:hypothetical protein [Levilactobacillus bambusae]PWG01070.1 hypothetical protein DCM90_02535 [Levilactobacillus bambusae]
MDELIFFNPGDSIGNFHDYNDAVQTAQIYREKNQDDGHVLVVQKTEANPTSFDIFLADDQITHKNEQLPTGQDNEASYKISKRF